MNRHTGRSPFGPSRHEINRAALYTATIRGMTIVESKYLTVRKKTGKLLERGYEDWRQRLARNCGRPTTGRWEPLTYLYPEEIDAPDPNLYLMQEPDLLNLGRSSREFLTGHPVTIQRLRKELGLEGR